MPTNEIESCRRTEIDPNLTGKRLTRKLFSTDLKTCILFLGMKPNISLLAVSAPIANTVGVGDIFKLSPIKEEVEGQSKKTDGDARIFVERLNLQTIKFLVPNNHIIPLREV